MNTALWVAQGLLAVGFATSGAMKLMSSREQLKAKGLAWVDDFSDQTVTLIGIAELFGATGLLLPPLLDIAPWLASVAAIGLATLMGLAVLTHIRRKETAGVVVALVLAGVAIFIAWGRLGPHGTPQRHTERGGTPGVGEDPRCACQLTRTRP